MAANSKRINANGSSLLSANPAKLKTVVICNTGATANTLTLYDNALGDTSGTVIAAIDTVQALTSALIFDVLTLKGLSATMAAGTAGDVVVTWE